MPTFGAHPRGEAAGSPTSFKEASPHCGLMTGPSPSFSDEFERGFWANRLRISRRACDELGKTSLPNLSYPSFREVCPTANCGRSPRSTGFASYLSDHFLVVVLNEIGIFSSISHVNNVNNLFA